MTTDVTTTPAYQAALTYEEFYVPGMFRYWTPLLLQRAAPQPGQRVLDVACGTGVVARSIVPLVGPEGKVIGLDINPSMLAVACSQFSEHCEDIEWREGRAEDLPFPDDDFDLVTCQQGIQFFKDRPKAAQEMRRVLRGTGKAVVEVWQSLEHNPFWAELDGLMASVFSVPIGDLAAPFAFGDPAELHDLLTNAGLRQVKVEAVTQDVHFADPARFVELGIRGAAAVIPAFATLDGHGQAELVATVQQRAGELLRSHMVEGVLTFPMNANIATGLCQAPRP